MIRSSNLCTEITLNTGPGETAVCNLGSINLANHIKLEESGGVIDYEKLKTTTRLAIRMLDNVVSGMWYPTDQSSKTNIGNRPLGLGIMGWQEALYKLNLPYSKAIPLAKEIQENIKFNAVQTSIELAKERGNFPNHEYSDFTEPRRNSHLLAIAPTATISHIAGTTPSIEPMFSNLFVESNLSGEFTNLNRWLVDDLERVNLWSPDIKNKIKLNNGTIQTIKEIPKDIREKYRTAFEIDQKKLIDCAAARQEYICQSQSLNLYMDTVSGKELSELYMYAWKSRIKTTYYLRTKAASGTDKVTCTVDKKGDCESCQ